MKKTLKIYTKKDYSSNDGMLTSVWGPALWHYLHTISFNYPVNPTDKDKRKYKKMIEILQYTLPCKYCRINLTKNLKVLPLTNDVFKNRDSFSKYIYNLHEVVNKMLCKKSKLTYYQVRERYENFRSRCINPIKITKKRKEKGCVKPFYGKKAKCVLSFVPANKKCETIKIDKSVIKKRIFG